MIFAEPVFRPGGDRFIEMELGDEMSFDLNFRVHSVSALIRGSGPAGIVEIVPELTSIMISYDFERISYADVVAEATALFHAVGPLDGLELDSRISEDGRGPWELPADPLFRSLDACVLRRLLRQDRAQGAGPRAGGAAQRP